MTDHAFPRRTFMKLGGLAALAGTASITRVNFGFAQTKLPTLKVITSNGNLNETLTKLQEGYLKEFGVETETTNVESTTSIMAGLVSGSYDVCIFAGINTVFPAVEKGADLRVIAGATLKLQQAIYSAKPEIKSMQDLVGKTVGVGPLGALLHAGTVAMLTKKGIDPDKVKFVNIGSSANIFKAVVAKTVDAGMSTTDFLDQQEKYGVHVVEGGKAWETLDDYTFQGAFASEKAITEKRASLVALLAAYAKMYRFISGPGSKEAYVKASVEAQGEGSAMGAAALWQFMNTNQTLAVNLVLDENRIEKLQKLNIEVGAQKTLLPYDKVADMSLARDALKLLGDKT